METAPQPTNQGGLAALALAASSATQNPPGGSTTGRTTDQPPPQAPNQNPTAPSTTPLTVQALSALIERAVDSRLRHYVTPGTPQGAPPRPAYIRPQANAACRECGRRGSAPPNQPTAPMLQRTDRTQQPILGGLGAMPPPHTLGGLLVQGESGSPAAAEFSNRADEQPAFMPPAGAIPASLPSDFSIGKGFVVPARLVARIQKGEYIDMKELLPDNVDLLRQEASISTDGKVTDAARNSLRKVQSIVTWARCFVSYAVVRAAANPASYPDLMLYLRMMLEEASRCGGEGWKHYDILFRKWVAKSPSTALWPHTDPEIYGKTFAHFGRRGGVRCSYCLDGDNSPQECAVAPLSDRPATLRRAREGKRTTNLQRIQQRKMSLPRLQVSAPVCKLPGPPLGQRLHG
eukprot:m.134838 g.134838  ORF g.134838 m.134838 type:complete len:404 (+) comp38153_c0_seq5:512-1723(+)